MRPMVMGATSKATCKFRTVPRGGDFSYMRCLLEAMHAASSAMGLTSLQAKHLSLLVRWIYARMVEEDLQCIAPGSLAGPSGLLIDVCVKQLAHAAAKQARAHDTKAVELGGVPHATTNSQIFEIKRTINSIIALKQMVMPKPDCTPTGVALKRETGVAAAAFNSLFGLVSEHF